MPYHCFANNNWDKCEFEKLFNRYCPKDATIDIESYTLKPNKVFKHDYQRKLNINDQINDITIKKNDYDNIIIETTTETLVNEGFKFNNLNKPLTITKTINSSNTSLFNEQNETIAGFLNFNNFDLSEHIRKILFPLKNRTIYIKPITTKSTKTETTTTTTTTTATKTTLDKNSKRINKNVPMKQLKLATTTPPPLIYESNLMKAAFYLAIFLSILAAFIIAALVVLCYKVIIVESISRSVKSSNVMNQSINEYV
jgi:hypothetical protein